MKPWVGYGAAGLLAYAIGLAALLPAEMVLARLAPTLEGQGLRLAARGVNGSLWQGTAQILAINGLRLDQVEWSASPWRLALGRLDLRLGGQLPGGGFNASLVAGPDSGSARGLDATFSAAMLTRYVRFPVTPTGSFVVHLDELAWRGDIVTAMRGRLLWRQAGLSAPEALAFGDLTVDLTPKQGGGIAGTLGDSGGPLLAAGEISFDPDGTYRIDARLAARESAPAELTQALRFLGKPDPQGRQRLTFSGWL